jgi:hypothetical protein
LDDNANLFDAGRLQSEEMIVKQSPSDSVGPDDREQLLLHRVRCREVSGAEPGNRDDGAFHTR